MEVNIRSKKFGEIIFQIDDEDYKIIENRKIYASKMNNGKLYLARDDKLYIHRLVMGEVPRNMVVDHINGDTLDNRKVNLRIVTPKENSLNTDKRKFSENEIFDILTSSLSNSRLAIKYNCSNALISYVRTGKLYGHILPFILREKRSSKGKLKNYEIKEIKNSNLPYSLLGKIYNIHKNTVYAIKKNERIEKW